MFLLIPKRYHCKLCHKPFQRMCHKKTNSFTKLGYNNIIQFDATEILSGMFVSLSGEEHIDDEQLYGDKRL